MVTVSSKSVERIATGSVWQMLGLPGMAERDTPDPESGPDVRRATWPGLGQTVATGGQAAGQGHAPTALPMGFTPGTKIATLRGARAIETLAAGDRVMTRDHGFQTLRWIGRQAVRATQTLAPVRIATGVLPGTDAPILVAPGQGVLLRTARVMDTWNEPEALVRAIDLVDGQMARREEAEWISYFQMAFDHHEIVFADGVASESLLADAAALAALTAEQRVALAAALGRTPADCGLPARRRLDRDEAQFALRPIQVS